MINFFHRDIAIFGLAKSGLAFKTFLQKNNFPGKIYLFDDNIEQVKKFTNEENIIICSPDEIDWENLDYIMISPGIDPKKNHPLLNLANINKTKIVVDIELFYLYVKQENTNAKFIGITGTNGKSTTTALSHHIIQYNNMKVENGGNIGIPIFDLPMDKEYYVLEISSYQLDLLKQTRFDFAILTNITPDHLERYDFKMENYINSKKHILDISEKIIISIDNENTKKIFKQINNSNNIITTSIENQHCDYYYSSDSEKTNLISVKQTEKRYKFSTDLIGDHNKENIINAFALCDSLNINTSTIIEAIETFKSLPHRLQKIREINNIIFVNDSKATSGDATVSAIRSFTNNEEIHLIIGGVPKTDGLSPLLDYIPRIHKFYLIGKSSNEFYNFLCEYRESQDIFICKDLEAASELAFTNCKKNKSDNETKNIDISCQKIYNEYNVQKVILLSPACASFDQFKNFEERGETFISIISNL